MSQITDMLDEAGVTYAGAGHSHARPGWVNTDCPWCGRDGGYHLGISLTTLACTCWKCGRHNTATALSMLTGQPYGAVVAFLADVAPPVAAARVRGTLRLPGGRGPLLPCHRAYLRGRGLNPATMARLWGVEGIGQAAHLRWRIFIPVHYAGAIVTWTTRSIVAAEKMRYISAPASDEAMPIKSVLYGADYTGATAIIHEGPVDVWSTGPGAVATCGTAYTEAQFLRMTAYPRRVVCFDAEADAQMRARVLSRALRAFPGETFNICLETGKDSAEADPEEIAELRARFLD